MSLFPPKRILVAVDLSEASKTAWRHARALAERTGATLEAIYIEPWQMGVDLLPPPALRSKELRALQVKIRAIVGEQPSLLIVQGDPAVQVLRAARTVGADLIVVGTHGRSGVKRALLGSVAEAVVRGAQIPVLVARGPVKRVRSLLSPVNFTRYAEHGFAQAVSAAVSLAAGLTVLHIVDDPIWNGNAQFRLKTMLERLPRRLRESCRAETRAVLGEAVPGILKAAKGHEWIVLVSHEKSALHDAIFGTTFEQVVRASRVPVLAVPAPSRASFASGETTARSGAGAGS